MTDQPPEEYKPLTPDEVSKLIADIPDEEFDGHTNFHLLTAEQKLEWLSSFQRFVYEVRGKREE